MRARDRRGALPTIEERRERDVLYRVLEIVSSSGDLETVLRSSVELVTYATGCDTCSVYVWDPEAERLVLRAAPARLAALVGRVRLPLGHGVAGWVAEQRIPVLLAEAAADDPRYVRVPELGGEEVRSMLSVPIAARDGRLVGVINAHGRRDGQFADDDLRVLQTAASLVAGSIENARLFDVARRKEEALAALVRETIEVQEEERRRVATEIHDGVTQYVVSIWFRVHACQRLLEQGSVGEALDELRAAKATIDETLAEARSAIYNLRPATLDDLGLVAALHEIGSRFGAETGIAVRLEAPDHLRLPQHVETTLYRIAQESLNNVRKHSEASSVDVRLEQDGVATTLAVSDDGRGFDAVSVTNARPSTSFGLAGMRERVTLIGGTLAIRSEEGAGTTVAVRVPVATEASSA